MTGSDDLPERPHLSLDASVAAHRQLIVLMLSLLAEDEQRQKELVEIIDQKLLFHDAHEDPGLEADTAFAFERQVNEEFRRVLEDARALLKTKRMNP